MLQPARGAYVIAMGPIASLRSLWTFLHIRRMGNPEWCRYCLPLSLSPTAAATAAAATDATTDAAVSAAAAAATATAAAPAAAAFAISRCIYPAVSCCISHIPLYPAVSRCIPLYPAISRNLWGLDI